MWAKVRQQLWEWRGLLFIAPTVTMAVIMLRLTGILQLWEWTALDMAFQLRPAEKPDDRIVIVGIDETDIQTYGTILSDEQLATLLKKIRQQQPRAIGLDLYRNLTEGRGTEKLTEVFSTTPNLIGITKHTGDAISSAIPPAPVLQKRGQIGANDVPRDADGKVRRSYLYLTSETEEPLESFGLKIALLYLKAKNVEPETAPNSEDLKLGSSIFPLFNSNDGAYVNADDGGYQILLNYRGPARTFRIVSARDIFQDKLEANWARDRIVLIGATATSKNDFFDTPYSSQASFISPENTSGVEVQANLTSQIISAALNQRPLIRVWNKPIEWVWIWVWSIVGTTISATVRSPRWTVFTLTLAGATLVTSYLLIFWVGWWIPLVPALLTLAGSAIVVTGYLANQEHEERQLVMQLFGRHVTPEIAETIWKNRDQFLQEGRLLGQRVTATVLFTDLKNFSTISEQLEPEDLMLWLNEYMSAMSQIVLEQGGVVDKFIGDAIMAVFGVPIPRTTPEEIAEDAQKAVRCAVQMATTLKALNLRWKEQGLPAPSMRVGISTGTVVTGSLGGQQRLEYTTIGDNVNVASRLESYDKSLDGGICRILINEEAHQYTKEQFQTQFINTVQLKGRAQSTRVYQVLLE
ncbi:MAG: adenylate/guanylate cyclase domain-containing protein [Scytolyngbya sp. HA4215-MV1]|nr:adenylate/guanylate cyclase domain-containing protein [Scytolyngbya sp. HA4215-MV1]